MGAVIVAICAIAASSVWSFLALRRSGQTLALAEATARRTEDRYRADRIEARRERLIDASVDVSYRVNSWMTVNAQYAAHLNQLAGARKLGISNSREVELALELQSVDTEKQRPALTEAHRAIQVAVLLFADTTDDVLSPENKALFDHQLDLVTRALINANNAVQAVNPETPELITSATSEMTQRRRQVSDSVGDLVKLAGEVIAKGKDRPHAIDAGPDDEPQAIDP